jgi:hypothetical protein
MPNLRTLRMQVEDIGNKWKRNVTVTFDYRTQSWIAGMGSHMASSLVGPTDALDQLKAKVVEFGLDATPTPQGVPAVDMSYETQAYERKDRPPFVIVLIFLVCVAAAAYGFVKWLGIK